MKVDSESQAEKKPEIGQWISAIVLIALWGIVLGILLTPEKPNGQAVAHSTYSAMDQRGAGAGPHDALLGSGWIFGSLLIAIFVSLLAWGTLGQTQLMVHVRG